jgi:hypothetical protein
MPVVTRSTAGTAANRGTAADPSVQLTPAADPPAAPSAFAPAITTVVQRVDGAAPSPTAASGDAGHSETELDELARALFGRIRGHLRSEVIHEREARGLTFDAF